jgi:uncharacterized protein YacL
MNRRWTLVLRLVGAVALAIAGYGAGSVLFENPLAVRQLIEQSLGTDAAVMFQELIVRRFLVSISFALFGSAIGYVLAPVLFRPLLHAYQELREVPPAKVLAATVGLAIGLLLSALVALPLSFLPSPFGQYLPFAVAVVLAYLGAATVGADPGAYLSVLRGLAETGHGERSGRGHILLDTSAIIDGRIADVAETGFVDKTLLVPRFVLSELQQVADSADALRRNRGRRGLEVLNRLQQSDMVVVEITDKDATGVDDVDRKLVRLAEQLGASIMTNDYNLNRVAEIQGIRVLNLNELANAVKTLLLPGEELEVHIIQEGKEHGQGVGYLEDGTMVVVERGRDHLDETLPVTVTRVLQTVAGRMIFATLNGQ